MLRFYKRVLFVLFMFYFAWASHAENGLDQVDIRSAALDDNSGMSVTEAASDSYELPLNKAISEEMIDTTALRAALERRFSGAAIRLTLDETVKIALVNNPDILIAEFEPEKAEADVFAAHGEFDLVLGQKLQFNDSTTSLDKRTLQFIGLSDSTSLSYGYGPVDLPETVPEQIGTLGGMIYSLSQQLRGASTFSAIDSTSMGTQTALGGKLKYGTQYNVTFDVNYEESTFDSFQGEYAGALGFTLTQPILRGFGKDINTIRIRAARNLRDFSEAQARLAVLNAIGDVIKAYWELAGAMEVIRVHENALRNAERLLEINIKRRDIGTAADIDVLQAKAGVTMRQSELINAYAQAADLGDRLKLALNLKEDGLFSKDFILPVDRPNTDAQSVFDDVCFEASVEKGVRNALEMRPEVSMADMEIANALLEMQRTRNEMLPQLDLVGSYSRGGRDLHFSRTLTGIREEQDRNYGFGIQASIPLGNHAARGAHQRARIGKRQAEEQRKKMEMALMMNVHWAARSIMTNKALVESNRQTVRLQEANVLAEEKRLRLGVTTIFQVVRMQEDLTAAQVQELQALIAFEKALVEFQIAEGSLLDHLGIHYNVEIGEQPVSWLDSMGF